MIKTKNKKINIRALPVKESQIRAVNNNDGSYTVSGYAVVFNQPSQPLPFIEYISRDALNDVDFSKTLLLYAHDYNKILARADSSSLKTEIDDNGLKFTAQIPDTTLGVDTFKNIQAGNVKGCSFGFTIAQGGDRWDTRDDGTTVHYVDKIDTVSELTLTAIPAYEETSVSAQVKRDLEQYLLNNNKEEQDLNSENNSNVVRSSAVASSAASTATSSAASSATSTAEIDEIVASAVSAAVAGIKTAVSAACHPGSAAKREDVDDSDVDDTADDSDIEDDSKGNQSSPASTAASSAVATSAADSSNTSSAISSATRQNQQEDNKEEHRAMIDITPKNNKRDALTEAVLAHDEYKRSGFVTPSINTRDTQHGNVTLNNQGKFFLPENILKAYQEVHQFPRLNQYVHTESVNLPNGKATYFDENDQVAQTREELSEAANFDMTTAKGVPYDVKAYSSKIRFSREQIAAGRGGNTDLMQIAQGQMAQIQNNTDDHNISNILTTNAANKITASDVIADMKTVLNVNLQPNDSEAAQIVLTQSAFNALDQLKDAFGRPLLQPDPTKSSSYTLFGKPVIKVADTLLGQKVGDKLAVITPLNKSVYKFTFDKVQGQFIDNFSSFDVILGVFFMQDIVAVRPDLMNLITITDKSLSASNNVVTAGAGK
ncbi:HK97 family phage prohead protease [Limosilactobacillus albertensis]|uniref:HK97 family phage prohead protease n=1 Tax=Limosilactobacillus albertensis TaxID=2759752 RepID=UPI0015F83A40|nr:HK97 family phage prohead protease [Limosilactobacillus albertensis]